MCVDDSALKEVNCCGCGKIISVKKRSPHNKTKCVGCNTIRTKSYAQAKNNVCKYCGAVSDQCKRPDICKGYRKFKTLIRYFGMREDVVGSEAMYEEYDRCVNIIHEEYYDNHMSIPALTEKYGITDIGTFGAYLKNSLGFKLRSKSDSLSNSFLVGRNEPRTSTVYKCGWHDTWNGKRYFYRSSYELDYCIELDAKQINYEMETLKFLYWDTQLCKTRTTIPDFYLPDYNHIIEIKSNWTYDKQNILDRRKEYLKHGYKFSLILEHKEVIFD
jgi:hypothetical protein